MPKQSIEKISRKSLVKNTVYVLWILVVPALTFIWVKGYNLELALVTGMLIWGTGVPFFHGPKWFGQIYDRLTNSPNKKKRKDLSSIPTKETVETFISLAILSIVIILFLLADKLPICVFPGIAIIGLLTFIFFHGEEGIAPSHFDEMYEKRFVQRAEREGHKPKRTKRAHK